MYTLIGVRTQVVVFLQAYLVNHELCYILFQDPLNEGESEGTESILVQCGKLEGTACVNSPQKGCKSFAFKVELVYLTGEVVHFLLFLAPDAGITHNLSDSSH